MAAYCGIDIRIEAEAYRNVNNTTNEFSNNRKSLSGSLESNKTSSSNNNEINYSIKYSRSLNSTLDNFSENDLEKVVIDSDHNISQESSSNYTKQILNDRLLILHKLMGDTVFLIEKIRNHSFPMNQFMSPLLSEDKIIAQFPKTCFIVSVTFLYFFNEC